MSRFFTISLMLNLVYLAIDTTADVEEILRMPGIRPLYDDTYHCTWKKIEGAGYIVAFDPLVANNSSLAHHLLLYGCKHPLTTRKPVYECSTICQEDKEERPRILYAWARQAPALHMPPRVGYPVGGSTGIKYLVLQVHYNQKSKYRDHTGVRLHITTKPQPNLAGIYMMYAYYGIIPPGRSKFSVDVSCRLNVSVPIHPFAFRVHAHNLGRSIVAYLVRGNNVQDGAVLLGRGNPQWPQAFYPIANDVLIRPGDFLLVRCIYDSSDRTTETIIGGKQQNEMCNIYIMYYKAAPRFSGQHRLTDIQCGGNLFRTTVKEGVRLWDLVPESSYEYAPALPPSVEGHKPIQADEQDNGPGLVIDDEWIPRGLGQLQLGQVSGVAVDSSGRLFVFHRARRVWDVMSFSPEDIFAEGPIDESPIFIFNASTGNLLHAFGAGNYYMPHGLALDPWDNLWLTDVGRHQVIKYEKNQWSKPSLVLGTKLVPGYDKDHFCKPTSTAVNSDGEIFVADGYCNSRIVKFDREGRFLKVFERAYDYMQIPHSLAIIPEQGLICVADRDRANIECFSQRNGESKFVLADSPAFGEALYGIAYRSESPGHIYGITSGTEPAARGGFTLDLASREVVAVWGRGHLDTPHALAVDKNKAVFVGQIQGDRRLIRFIMASAKVPKSNNRQPSNSLTGSAKNDLKAQHSNATYSLALKMKNIAKSKGVTFWLGLTLIAIILSIITVYACFRCQRRGRVGSVTRYGPVLRERKGFELLVNQDDDEDVTFDRHANGPISAATNNGGSVSAIDGKPVATNQMNSHPTPSNVPPSIPPREGDPLTRDEQPA